MAVEDALRFGCVFCGHRQPTDEVCGACKRDRTLDLRDAGVRDLFRDTEVRAREKREGKARMFGAIAGVIALIGFMLVPDPGILKRTRTILMLGGTFAIAFGVMVLAERKLDRRLFPWLDEL